MKNMTVKYRTIVGVRGNGDLIFCDRRYTVNLSIMKIIKKCLKMKLPFKFRFHNSSIIDNEEYLEIYDDAFCSICSSISYEQRAELYKRGDLFEKFLINHRVN